MTTTVSYASIIADDIDALCAFYGAILDLPEVDNASAIYRGLTSGNGVVLAFSAPAVNGMLGIDEYRNPTGTRQYLTFELATDEAVELVAGRAVARGARVLRQPYVTGYHAYQAVLADPEGNVFRLNHSNTIRHA